VGSIKFFHSAGIDSVSCGPFRIAIAKLAAAQAVIEQERLVTGEIQLVLPISS